MDWLRCNSMCLNIEKTKVMMFGTEKKLRQSTMVILSNGVQLDVVHNLTYLGVILDSSLKWTKHIDSVISKISRVIGIIRRIKYYITKKY